MDYANLLKRPRDLIIAPTTTTTTIFFNPIIMRIYDEDDDSVCLLAKCTYSAKTSHK